MYTGRMIALDIEATGTDPYRDRIIEIALVNVSDEDAPQVICYHRINPQMEIPEDSTKVHGITNDDVAGWRPFEAYADYIQNAINSAVILGYSSRAFDTIMLDAELRRAGCPGIDMKNVLEIDLYRVLCEAEPRTLVGSVWRFLKREHKDAHGALADAMVLGPLYQAMREELCSGAWGEADFIAMSKPAYEVDRSGKLRKNETGEICWNFGQSRGEPVKENVDLIFWVLNRDFPDDTKAALRRILEEIREDANANPFDDLDDDEDEDF